MMALLEFCWPASAASNEPTSAGIAVIAANNDGQWNQQDASVRFQIERTFYQTRFFIIACIVAVILLVIGLVVLQMRQIAAKLRDRLEVRHAERERIARELHDTLLQGIQGLILRFQAIAEHIPEKDPIRVMIDQALDRADGVLVDGRDRVRDLRMTEGTAKDLAVTFAALGKELSADYPVTFRVVSSGIRHEIDPAIREEIYLIGREALLNAFQHAQAREIEVELCCDFKQLRVCVRDDGIGIDPKILDAGGKPGHWGLVGMRERATCVGGQLMIWARPGAGTDVELTVPASIAYVRKHSVRWKRLKHMLSWGREA
ncbi:hypothetical protein GCM10007862_11010 [Dyella lipolytica]|nr:hypothetical protein GCM10007862_11010 [Dyella lipolytica]